MSSQIVIYECDTCKRQTEITLDGTRPDPVRCTITFKCRGKYSRVRVRHNKQFLFTPIVPGLQDYVQRGTVTASAAAAAVLPAISIFTSALGVLALSAVHRAVSGVTANFSITDINGNNFIIDQTATTVSIPTAGELDLSVYPLTPELLTYSQYTYVVLGTVSLLSGPDSSQAGLNLRFNSSNNVTIYANGIQLASSAFDRSVDNQITFTPSIVGSNNVIDIFVSNNKISNIDPVTIIKLKFTSLSTTIPAQLALRSDTCWGDYVGATINGVTRISLFCTDVTALSVNQPYGIFKLEATSSLTGEVREVQHSDFFFLLGKEPFAFQDKELFAYVSGTNLIDNSAELNYTQSIATGALQLSTDSNSVTQIFNQIIPYSNLTSVTPPTVALSTTAQGSEELVRLYIKGPS